MSNGKPKIFFVHDWEMPLNEYLDNEDGLPAAIEVIAKTHEVNWITRGPSLTFRHKGYNLHYVSNEATLIKLVETHSPDVFLCWGSLDRPYWKLFHESFRNTPKVLCFAGGPREHIAKSYFRVIVCESKCYVDDFTKAGVTAVRGFGTNTMVFNDRRLPKVWDAIYPASLCFHKNLELFAKSLGGRGLCVGNHNEPTIVSKILSLGSSLVHRVSSNVLADLYNMSRVTVITCGPQGGAQRVVLESMACGIPVIVMNDHDRCTEFIEESGFGRICHPIETDIIQSVNELIESHLEKSIGINYVTSNWSEYAYADSIIKSCSKAMEN